MQRVTEITDPGLSMCDNAVLIQALTSSLHNIPRNSAVVVLGTDELSRMIAIAAAEVISVHPFRHSITLVTTPHPHIMHDVAPLVNLLLTTVMSDLWKHNLLVGAVFCTDRVGMCDLHLALIHVNSAYTAEADIPTHHVS